MTFQLFFCIRNLSEDGEIKLDLRIIFFLPFSPQLVPESPRLYQLSECGRKKKKIIIIISNSFTIVGKECKKGVEAALE